MKKEIRTILRNRSRAMAQEPELKTEASYTLEVIVFNLAGETYGVDSAFVREVYPLNYLVPLPGVPAYISGIINVRGKILPVVDIKQFFNLPGKGAGHLSRIIILANEQMEFGIPADSVESIRSIESRDIEPVPGTVEGIGAEYLKGVNMDNLIILNAEKLLSDKRLIVYDNVK